MISTSFLAKGKQSSFLGFDRITASGYIYVFPEAFSL